ncbi:MAG TPA: hypothetical protein VM901_02625 [Bdellovibrionota bacterium]|nr:hypothetical protein [Bdellovibrionota bacterium]
MKNRIVLLSLLTIPLLPAQAMTLGQRCRLLIAGYDPPTRIALATEAVKGGDLELLKKVVTRQNAKEMDSTRPKGSQSGSLLHLAAQERNFEALDYLLRTGMDARHTDLENKMATDYLDPAMPLALKHRILAAGGAFSKVNDLSPNYMKPADLKVAAEALTARIQHAAQTAHLDLDAAYRELSDPEILRGTGFHLAHNMTSVDDYDDFISNSWQPDPKSSRRWSLFREVFPRLNAARESSGDGDLRSIIGDMGISISLKMEPGNDQPGHFVMLSVPMVPVSANERRSIFDPQAAAYYGAEDMAKIKKEMVLIAAEEMIHAVQILRKKAGLPQQMSSFLLSPQGMPLATEMDDYQKKFYLGHNLLMESDAYIALQDLFGPAFVPPHFRERYPVRTKTPSPYDPNF